LGFLFKSYLSAISFFALIFASLFFAHFVIIFAASSYLSFSNAILSISFVGIFFLCVFFDFFIFPNILSNKLFFISLGLAVLLYGTTFPFSSTKNFLSVSAISISSFFSGSPNLLKNS